MEKIPPRKELIIITIDFVSNLSPAAPTKVKYVIRNQKSPTIIATAILLLLGITLEANSDPKTMPMAGGSNASANQLSNILKAKLATIFAKT